MRTRVGRSPDAAQERVPGCKLLFVTSEIAEVTREDLPGVEVKVEEALERSSSSKNRTIARQAAAKAAKVTPAAAVAVAAGAVGGAVAGAGIRRAARAS